MSLPMLKEAKMSIDKNRGAEVRSLDEVVDLLRKHIPDLSERYGVIAIGVFGSWARGVTHPNSDLDLLVELDDPSLSLLRFVALKNELSDLLGIPVDLVEKDGLKPAIGKRILSEVVYV
jgi:uncharacterized protein